MTYTVNMDKYSLTNVAPFKYYYIQYTNTTYIQNTLPITHFSIIYGTKSVSQNFLSKMKILYTYNTDFNPSEDTN